MMSSVKSRSLALIGMQSVDQKPKWLTYEHRAWFPKLTEERPPNEAVYLWLPGERAKAFLQSIAAYASGKAPLKREKKGQPGQIEEYKVEILTTEYEGIVERFGSLEKAIEEFPYEIFAPPPAFARLTEDYEGQPLEEIVF